MKLKRDIAPRTSGVYELLKSKIDLTELVEQFADVEDGRAFCPLNEQTSNSPAFTIYDGDTFYCHSCEAWGDVVSFWRIKHGFSSNWEAAQDLAHRYGIELPQMDPEAKKRYEERKQREATWEAQARENHERLLGSSTGAKRAREYLASRGFGPDAWERFMLGLNAEQTRVTVPYWSAGSFHGQVARALNPDAQPKYLYPSKEEWALGRRTLFMQESPKAREYLLVEGFFDQLSAAVLEIPAIAAGSAGFSKEQIADLLDMAHKGATFVINRDKDERGRERAQKTLEQLYPYARLMPDLPGEGVKDVADFYKEHGEAAARLIRDLMEEAADALELAKRELEGISRELERVRFLKQRIIPLVLQVPAQSERGALIKSLSRLGGLNADIVKDALGEVQGRLITEIPAPGLEEEEVPEEEWRPLLAASVLDRYSEDAFKIKSVVGDSDRQVVKLLFLDALEAQLEPLPTGKPIGGPVMLTGDSGRGKNFLADAAVSAMPEEWYLSFEAASATAFYYAAELDPGFLKHKFIYPNEAEAVDTVVEFLRPMFSQAKAKKYVTNKNSDGSHVFQEIDVEGPITGVVPTTRNTLNKELQTRMLVVELTDYEDRVKDHTAALSKQFSPDFVANPHSHVIPKWRAALRSLTEVRKVVIPFGSHEEFRLTNEEIAHGARLWGNLLGLICAHAWLEQNNREIRTLADGTEAVVANASDYEVAYGLLKAVGGRSVVNLGETHRKIVNAVYELKQERKADNSYFGSAGFTVREIAEQAGFKAPSTVSKHRTFLVTSAQLLQETSSGHLTIADDATPSWWDEGKVMEGFPLPEQVTEWEGDTHAPNGKNPGNTETPGQKPHRYAEHSFPEHRNTSETVSEISPNGNGFSPGPDMDDALDALRTFPDSVDAETVAEAAGYPEPEHVELFENLLEQLVDEGLAVVTPNGWIADENFYYHDDYYEEERDH